MLFMSVYTTEPGKRDQTFKKRIEKGISFPAGVKVIGEWSDLGGGRGFIVTEAQDPKSVMQATLAWSDLLKIEIVPVIETEELMKLVK